MSDSVPKGLDDDMFKTIVSIVLTSILAAIGWAIVDRIDMAKELTKQDNRVTATQDRITATQERISDIDKRFDRIETKIDRIEEKIDRHRIEEKKR